jgi:alanyl-tRNA synthetase
MNGNFSFGDYFKKEAIGFAWELLTGSLEDGGLGFDPERLWVTVYNDDDEAIGYWLEQSSVPRERIQKRGMRDNYWSTGQRGPAGPCSEIYFDQKPDRAGTPVDDSGKFAEIWNLVFTQYDRRDGGKLVPLANKHIDTGMGLERIAAVLQHVHSNYEIDLFVALIAAAARETGCQDLSNNSLKVIADHIRACCFLVVDGVIPSNEGRGYVLRRIVRRALRHGYKLGQTKPFFYRMVPDLVQQMGEAYPELPKVQDRVMQILKQRG